MSSAIEQIHELKDLVSSQVAGIRSGKSVSEEFESTKRAVEYGALEVLLRDLTDSIKSELAPKKEKLAPSSDNIIRAESCLKAVKALVKGGIIPEI